MCSHSHRAHGAACGCAAAGETHSFHDHAHHHYPGHSFPGGLGVRRPLRFLAWKLGLSESQVAELATVLNALKTERAQAEVDDRRALAMLADATQGEPFDSDKAAEAARLRAQSAQRVQQSVVESLARIHALLEPEQRARLAYLLRTGALVM
jgi:Spy/CpxP family protein refolding chaperone